MKNCQESVTDPEKAAGRVNKDEKVGITTQTLDLLHPAANCEGSYQVKTKCIGTTSNILIHSVDNFHS